MIYVLLWLLCGFLAVCACRWHDGPLEVRYWIICTLLGGTTLIFILFVAIHEYILTPLHDLDILRRKL